MYEFYLQTTYNSPKGRLVKIDLNNVGIDNWEDIIFETKNTLHSSKVVNENQILVIYKKNLIHELQLYSIEGEFVKDITLPSKGSLRISADWRDSDIFYSFTSFLYPTTIFQLNIDSGKSEVYWEADMNFDNSKYTVEQKFYSSKDGTQIPMFIIYNKLYIREEE